MKAILGYLRGVIGLRDDEIPSTFKRNREQDDDPPVMKKYKTVTNIFPKVVMPSDEDEWTAPRRVGEAPRTRYIPIVKEVDLAASTSTPANNKGSNYDVYDFGKSLGAASLCGLSYKKPTSSRRVSGRSETLVSSFDIPLSKSKIGKAASNISKAELEKRAEIETAYQNRFLNVSATSATRFHSAQNEDENLYVPEVVRDRRFFKSKNSPILSKEPQPETIDLSDSEDYDLIVLKRVNPATKNQSNEFNGHSPHRCDDDFEDTADLTEEGPCTRCKPRLSEPGRSYARSGSPKGSRQSFGRFKTPLTLSKAMRLNSYTPFWKSQKSYVNRIRPLQKRTGGVRLPDTTRSLIEKCFRLDDKKRYEELIRLSSSNFSRKKSLHVSNQELSDTQRRILNLTSSISLSNNFEHNDTEVGQKIHNGVIDIDSPEEPGGAVVLSDSDPEQVVSADDASTSSSVRILPVNSLRQSFQERPLINSTWLENLDKKYKNMHLEKKREESDCIVVSTTQSKSNREFWLKKKQNDVKSLRVYDLTDEPEEIEEVPLPELTEEQQKLINNALRPNPSNQVLIEKFNMSIHRRDIQTLAGLNWLNDEVINFYMNLIMERAQENKDLPKVYGMNTFFYPKLMQSGHSGLKRWTRKVDLFAHDLMLIPVHLGIHWCMSIIDFRKQSIKYFDSMGGKNMDCCDALLKYLEDESMDKRKEKMDTSEWGKECLKDIPQQMNGSDCGMFSCTFAEFLSRDASISFSQNDMPYLRRKMILEIVTGKLLL